MQKDTVLVVLISEFADWEPALLSAGLRWGYGLWDKTYDVKFVSPVEGPVFSLGGLKVIPDYTIAATPEDFAALILIGGTSWFGEEARSVLPLLQTAVERRVAIGAICDASLFLAANGFLNTVAHTGAELAAMKAKGGPAYTGESRYKAQQCVRDGNIITARPTGYVEFAREVLAALGVASEEKLNEFYSLCKHGG